MKMDSVHILFTTQDHETGQLFLVFTAGYVRENFPTRTCSKCKGRYPALDFLKGGKTMPDGYFEVTDGDTCSKCVPRQPIPIHRDHRGRLRMRLTLRDGRGAPLHWFDESTRRWRVWSKVGLRLMKPDGNEIRCQPYSDRSAAKKRKGRQVKKAAHDGRGASMH